MQNSTSGNETARERVALLAGYSYKANQASPLGFPELNIKQGQKLTLVEKHATNEHWWKVESEDGDVGYVPANYVMIQEKKPSTLPWLKNKEPEEDVPAEKPAWKAYVSAYNSPTTNGTESKEAAVKKDYYCHVCDKTLNGPKPYGAHMASKAHKEEVEVAKEMGREI